MKKGKKLLLAMLFVTLLCGVTGCGSNDRLSEKGIKSESAVDSEQAVYGLQDNGAGMAYDEDVIETAAASVEKKDAADEELQSNEGSVQKEESGKKDSQKIIKTYQFSYETEKFEEACSYLKEQVDKYHGYVSSSEMSGMEYRTLYFTARIPAESADEFTGQLGSLGTVIRQSESAEDVTLQYADTESRIASLKTEQERLNELLKKADSLETIIALEDRLTEVRYELESHESRKKLLDDRISYSTVDIVLEEVSYTVPVDDSTFVSRISTGLQSSFRDIAAGTVDFLVWFIVSLPYLLLWAILLCVVIMIIRKIRKHRRMKKQAVIEGKEPKENK